MKIQFNKLLVLLFLSLAMSQSSFAQLTVPNVTACPCQVMTVTPTWNNVSNVTYSLYAPPTPPPGSPTLTSLGAFTVASTVPNCTQVAISSITYTLVGSGVFGGNPITNTATFVLTVIPPAAMTLTVSNALAASNIGYHCHNSPVTITAPIGGASYGYTSTSYGLSGNSLTNGIPLGPLTTPQTGTILVTSTIGGCFVAGTATIFVAPFKALTVTNPTNICEHVGCPTLTASLPGGTNFQWTLANNSPTAEVSHALGTGIGPNCDPTIADAGVYTAYAEDDPFGVGLFCPHTATTQVIVVQTSPVLLTASPSTAVCQGDNLNLTATAGGLATGWSWSGPGFSSSIANPVITPALPTNSGCYTATAIFQGAFLACTTTAAICVTVVPVASPNITMPTSVCQGDNFVVSANASSNPDYYSWYGPLFTGSVATTGAVIPITGVPTNASGTQFVTAHFSYGSTQCASTNSMQLNVVPVNTITMYPPKPVCTPDNAFLQALATGASQYSWVGPNGYTNNGPNVWVTYPTPSASGIYTVTAYFGSGSSLVCSNTNTVSLTVNPTLPFSLIPRQLVCYNTPITISGPSGATSYTWTSSTGFTSNDKDFVLPSAQPKHTGDYTLTVSLGPCITSAESRLDVLTPITFTLKPFDRTICAGDTLFLEGGATGGSENYAFVWNPAIYLESSNGPKQMAIPLGSVGYNLIAHDIACPNYTIAHSFSITANKAPQPKLQLSQEYGCAPLCLSLDPKTGKDAFVNNFDFGDGQIFQQQDTMPFTRCLEAGVYNLKVYSVGKNGCTGYFNYPAPIVVEPKPGTDIHWSPETPTTNDVLTFYPTHSSDAPVTYYTWNFLGGVTPGDTLMNNLPDKSDTTNVKNPVRAYSNYGTYPVVLISQNDRGCIDTVYKFVKVIDELQIYVPNTFTPNDDGINDVFMAKGTGVKIEGFTMDIFNRAGQNVFSTKDINEGWNGKVGGQVVKDATYIYKIKAVGMNGEGRREFIGYINVIK